MKLKMKAIQTILFLALFVIPLFGQGKKAEPAEEPVWIDMFNGENLEGWTPKIKGYESGDNYANTFRVVDGLLTVSYDAYEGAFDKRFGHLFYESEFSNYVMRLEYRFIGDQIEGGPGWATRNSGIMIHGQSPNSMALDQDFPASIEVQLLGGNGTDDRPTLNLCTPGTNVVMNGDLSQRHCTNSTSSTYHGEQWVSVEVEVRGNEVIRHKIDGEVVLEYQHPQLDPRDADAQKLLQSKQVLLFGGSISLQSESHPVQFRNVQIRELGEGE